MIFVLTPKIINFKSMVAGLVLFLPAIIHSAPVSASNDSVLIYQVQTASANSASEEFVAIYNNSPHPTEVTGWCLEYSSASDVSKTRLACLESPDDQTQLWLSGYSTASFASDEFVQSNPDWHVDAAFKAGMSTTSGHVKILNQQKELEDLVGWGVASKPEGNPAQAHSAGRIIQRLHLNATELLDTDNNAVDFHEVNFRYVVSGLYEEHDEQAESPPQPGLYITEILPDGVGSDSGKEFIELYNFGQSEVDLRNYLVQVGPTFSKSYSLPEVKVAPGEYLALSDEQTGITLPNTAGSVRVMDPFGNILDTSHIYEKPGEGVSLARFDNGWALTYEPTPGFKNVWLPEKPCPQNQTRNPETGRCRSALGGSSSEPKPCRPDQVRNPETNRCRKISSLTANFKSCKPGQVRSLETNRCRSATSKTKAKVPCKSDQMRNPETGRCKKVSSASAKKPCKPGQERNVQTGRCRKIPPPINKNEIKDIESSLVTNNFKWWFAGASALGSVGYGAYEWRRELLQAIAALKIRFMG